MNQKCKIDKNCQIDFLQDLTQICTQKYNQKCTQKCYHLLNFPAHTKNYIWFILWRLLDAYRLAFDDTKISDHCVCVSCFVVCFVVNSMKAPSKREIKIISIYRKTPFGILREKFGMVIMPGASCKSLVNLVSHRHADNRHGDCARPNHFVPETHVIQMNDIVPCDNVNNQGHHHLHGPQYWNKDRRDGGGSHLSCLKTNKKIDSVQIKISTCMWKIG